MNESNCWGSEYGVRFHVELEEGQEGCVEGWGALFSEPLTLLDAEGAEAIAGGIGGRGDLDGDPFIDGG